VTNKIKNGIKSEGYYLKHPQSGEPVWQKSRSKVIFSGLGADEVFGGYSRYKTAALKNGS